MADEAEGGSKEVLLGDAPPDLETLTGEKETPVEEKETPVDTDVEDPDKEVEEEPEKEAEEELEEGDEGRETKPGYALVKQLEAEAPGILKKIPGLRNTIMRGYAFNQVFPDIAAAKEAAEDSETFREFESDLKNGEITKLLVSVEEISKEGYQKICKNFLPDLFKRDREQFAKATAPIINNMIAQAYMVGEKEGPAGKNLKNAALHLAKFYLGVFEPPKFQPLVPEGEDPAREEIRKEREAIDNERFDSAKRECLEDLNTAISSMIESGISQYKLSSFNKRAILKEAMEELSETLSADRDHLRTMGRIWEDAKRNKFRESPKPRIRHAYLGRARNIVPSIIRRLVKEAGLTPESPKPKEQRTAFPSAGNATSRMSVDKLDPNKVDWSKTDTKDLFSGKATLK